MIGSLRGAAGAAKAPVTILDPIDPAALDAWLEGEIGRVIASSEREIVRIVLHNLTEYVCWPREAILVVKGAVRTRQFHTYPTAMQAAAERRGIVLDGRSNGPAIAAFLMADGRRPSRFGNSFGWTVAHVYSGKFPYCGRKRSLAAARHPNHFTQSAGLVAVHPIADQMLDEYPFFAWLLRFIAFQKFGYDPDCVFQGQPVDEFGFADRRTSVLFSLAEPRDDGEPLLLGSAEPA